MNHLELPDHVRFTAQRAADVRGVPVEDWLAQAVHELAQADHIHRSRVERRPGPWPNWTAFVSRDGSDISYVSPDGEEINRLDTTMLDRRYRQTDARRPWMARDREGALRNRIGSCRTFTTAEAAKAALDKHYSVRA